MAFGLKRYVTFNPVNWVRQVLQMRRFVRSYRPISASGQKSGHFAVIVMPWLGTAVPWFSIASGLVLASRGTKVTFVVDSLPFGYERRRFRMILICIRSVLRVLPKQFAIREIKANRSYRLPTEAELALIERLATLNTTWELKGETKSEWAGRILRAYPWSNPRFGGCNWRLFREITLRLCVRAGGRVRVERSMGLVCTQSSNSIRHH